MNGPVNFGDRNNGRSPITRVDLFNHSQILVSFKILFDSSLYYIKDQMGFIKLGYSVFSHHQFHLNFLESTQLLQNLL